MTHPTGTVTFLFTDIEGSTKLAQEYPDAMLMIIA
jgi:class 3 adenylate cyclase